MPFVKYVEIYKKKSSVIIFILFFLFFYGCCILIISFSSNDGVLYSKMIREYFDVISWLRYSLLIGSKFFVELFGYETRIEPNFLIRILHARGVIIAYDCAGYGVMSFWLAFILAFPRDNRRKWLWGIGGLFLLWLINVFRITFFMISINQGWKFPLGIDHHTWFNVISYFIILTLIYLYEFPNRNLKGTQNRV